MAKFIPLSKGRHAIVDDELFDRIVDNGPWSFDGRYASKSRRRMPKLYMHKLVCELASKTGDGEIDHVDRNKLNNQRDNLVLTTRSSNMHNRSATKKSLTGVKGVTWDKHRQQWIAQIKCNGVLKNLGRFSVLEDAITSRLQTEVEQLGHPVLRAVFLDIDDTLNSLTMPALNHVGCNVSSYPNPGSYDIVGIANSLLPEPLTVGQFWDRCDREFWVSLPKSVECEMITRFAGSVVGLENTCILTAPTLDPECASAKVEWIYRNLPENLHRQYLIGPRKFFCAHHQHLLIDDSDTNVRLFRKHGGHAILVPRPWNSLHGRDTNKHLTEQFSLYCGNNSCNLLAS